MKSDRRIRVFDLAGLALAVVGAVLIAVGWYALQDERTVVEQLPYLVSGGIGGLAAVIAGAAVVHLSRQFRLEREVAQVAAAQEELREALQAFVVTVGDQPDGPVALTSMRGGRGSRRSGRLARLEELSASDQQG